MRVVIVSSFAGQGSHYNPVLQRNVSNRDRREQFLLRHGLLQIAKG